MAKKLTSGFWGTTARIILRNRIVILVILFGITLFLSSQWKYIQFTNTEANLLPDHHPVNVDYNKFLDTFGEEGNVMVIAVKDSAIFNLENFNKWNKLSKQIQAEPEVDLILSTDNLQTLVKNTEQQKFKLTPLIQGKLTSQQQLDSIKEELFHKLPFYESLLYNKETQTIRSVIYMDKEIVNTAVRKNFVLNNFIPMIEDFEADTGIDVKVSGMPYIRSLNADIIIGEIGLFIGATLLVTSFIFFLFFRSFRATFISMCVVIIGVMWAFGILGLLGYEITILTALIPPLIIVIGIPNCIFLINKYQQEVQKHGNQAKSLQRVISKVGDATLMTNLTTAAGFATFIITESTLLKEFGIVASINIIAIFILSILIIPIVYSFMYPPKYKHLKHLNKRWVGKFVKWMENTVRHHRITVFISVLAAIILSIIGIYQIRISGSLLEDMPQGASFFNDIKFFEEEFDGILPVEIMVDTQRKNGVMNLSTLRRMDELETLIKEIPELSAPISVTNLVKYSKQAYYNGNPNYYQLPNNQEKAFIMSYAKGSTNNTNLLSSFVDSTGQIARITTFMKDIGTEQMEDIKADIEKKVAKVLPEDRYQVTLTGKALVFMQGTKYLVKNLMTSLGFAIFLISLLMAYLFRSFRMIMISLIPNILPLLITAGMMGFLGIPIKPSTILVFSVAFGISVDDTIHFLAKYRQELIKNNWRIRKSVFGALRESGISMFYTSVVLFFGFSVFMLSSFGGTKALGGLVSFTLLIAMLSNLIVLPSLLLALERNIANKKTLKKPSINVLPKNGDELEEKS